MTALGADPEPMVAEEGEPAGARAETPPPDERAFEDDDGTHYVWDGGLAPCKTENHQISSMQSDKQLGTHSDRISLSNCTASGTACLRCSSLEKVLTIFSHKNLFTI